MSAITYKLAIRFRPSFSAPGKFNILNDQGHTMSVDPNGVISWNDADGNYEQCVKDGMGFVFQPGGDQDPSKPLFLFLPTDLA